MKAKSVLKAELLLTIVVSVVVIFIVSGIDNANKTNFFGYLGFMVFASVVFQIIKFRINEALEKKDKL